MPRVSIAVNGLSLVHKESGGVSTATLPDVCRTPPSGAPVPYVNVARSRDLEGGTASVRVDGGQPAAIAGSTFARSTGDEPGAAGGLVSSVSGREARWLSHSFDVRIEGRGACRLTDKMLHNRSNTIDCGGVQQPPVHTHGTRPGHRSQRPQPPAAPTRFGIDTNGATLDIGYAKKRGTTFVGRYLSFDGSHPVLSVEEVREYHKAKLQVFCIWELTKYRTIEAGSVSGELTAGAQDAQTADGVLNGLHHPGQMIYFTVDFKIGPGYWKTTLTDNVTGQPITYGDLILAYFTGVNSVIGVPRTGAYGTFTTISQLFGNKKIKYGWQMTFNKRGRRIDHRAQLHQTHIYPLQAHWGVSGAGALDFDEAVAGDFGQW